MKAQSNRITQAAPKSGTAYFGGAANRSRAQEIKEMRMSENSPISPNRKRNVSASKIREKQEQGPKEKEIILSFADEDLKSNTSKDKVTPVDNGGSLLIPAETNNNDDVIDTFLMIPKNNEVEESAVSFQDADKKRKMSRRDLIEEEWASKSK